MRSLRFACLLLAAAALPASRTSEYQAVTQKFRSIEKAQVKPGARIAIPENELNAYVTTELPKVAPPGVRNPRVDLTGDNIATGRALIDFLKLRSARGKSSNWLMRKLLDGEREVAVTTRVRSANGTATVFVDRVEVSGMPIEGAALDFLIDNYLRPNYPDAKIGQPFALAYKMDRLEVKRGVAYVHMRR